MKNRQSYKIPVIISIILHAIIFALLFVHFSPSKVQTANNVNVVQAVVVAQSQLKLRPCAKPNISKTESLVPMTPSLPENTIRKIEQVALKQPREMVVLQEPKMDETAALKKHEEEQKKKKVERKKKEAQLAKRQREAEAKQLQKELAQELKPNEETSSQAEKNVDQEEDLDAQLNAEKKQLSSTKQSQAQQTGEVDKYKQMIVQTISRKWLIPETQDKELACQLLVHVGPGGIVLSVDVLKESGDPNLDRSASNAIMKASPLPVPENSELFDNFRALRLTFRPRGIISG